MPFTDDRIFQIAMAVIAFQLSISVAGLIMPIQPLAGVTNLELIKLGLSSWTSWIGLGTAVAMGIAGITLSVPIGAVAYATVYGVGSVPMGATIEHMVEIFGTTNKAITILDSLGYVIMSLMTVLFIWTFIKLAR